MNAKAFLLFALTAFVLLEGCVTSLYPLYTSKDLVYDPRLLGSWTEEEDGSSWKLENNISKELEPLKDPVERQQSEAFKRSLEDPRTYLLTTTEKGESGEFLANLVKLDKHFFLDIFPKSLNLKNSFLQQQYLPVHTYAKIVISGSRTELYFFNNEKLYKLMDENRIRLKHESLKDYKVITAGTAELQQFVKKFADDKEFFEKPVVLKK